MVGRSLDGMKVRLRVQHVETHALGEDIEAEGADYYATLAAAQARIPAGFILNAILVDR